MKNLGGFKIHCTIRSSHYAKALCNLGAGVNLIPRSVFRKFELGEQNSIVVSLQFANRSIKHHPLGIIENVLVKVEKFIFLVDFIVLNIEDDKKLPLILERHFVCHVENFSRCLTRKIHN